jgi:hypothetical protein
MTKFGTKIKWNKINREKSKKYKNKNKKNEDQIWYLILN